MAYGWELHFLRSKNHHLYLEGDIIDLHCGHRDLIFLKCSDHPIGMGCPLEVECWCWRMNLRITSKIRSHKIIIKSSTECLGTQPAFNAFVPEIPTFARMCTKHQWFPIRARRHSTRWLYSHCKLHTSAYLALL